MRTPRNGRRANKEGSFDYLPSGRVRFVKMINSRRVYGPSATNRQEAKDLFEKKMHEEADAARPECVKFGFFFHDQLTRIRREFANTTTALYETIYETHVRCKPIALIPVDELTSEDVEGWLRSLPFALSARSQQRYLQCVKALLEYARKIGLIVANPASPVKAAKASEHSKQVLSKPDVDNLLGLQMSPRLRKAIILCLHGLRRGECCALRYEDFDEAGFTVRRSIQEVNGTIYVQNSTKTGKNRWVPMSDRHRFAIGSGEGYVLETKTGSPLRPRNLARQWDSLVKGTEFEDMTLHDLRSTFASLLLQSGTDVRTSAEILGHSPAMLSAIYARTKKEIKSAAVAKIFE